MREAFHTDLADLRFELSRMCADSGTAMRLATQALLTVDLDLAEHVLDGDVALDRQRNMCEEHAYELLALQAPVARDLRIVLAAVYCAEKIERMGDLAAHVAAAARLTHPHRTVPAELTEAFDELGVITSGMADRIGALIAEPMAGGFAELESTDQSVDTIHSELFQRITDPGWPHGPASASRLALVARFYERFGDQAVSVAKRIEFTLTGVMPAA